ncbi:MAG TPA: tRNA-uridine aminocarboxypropyltransferase [Opitutaceae bacterium]|nr:tRNA-uridine aminocarboxypropyltransferase [Opitutaceae bacterium]
MPRSVILQSQPRCERCRFSPRWCICSGERTIECPLAIDVLIHHREFWRPTSTGRLINRVIPASRGHVFRHDLPLIEAAIHRPGRELWILHPLGEPLAKMMEVGRISDPPSGAFESERAGHRPAPPSPAPQVLLLDGSWREAARMMHGVKPWGRLVSLPMTGPSRYLLRDQQGAGNYSTVEALLFLLDALGLKTEHAALRLQFELHVYAGLRARGEKSAAENFLADSPVRDAFPELLEELNRRRPRE